MREAAASQRGGRPLQKRGLSPLTSSHGFICDRLYVRADMCIQTRWTGETRWRHTSDNCLDSPGFVNYIPLEMNRARRHVIAPDYQQTELSSGLAANQARVERRGKLSFCFGPTASASLRLGDPGDSKCQNVPRQRLCPPRPLHHPPLALSRLSLQKNFPRSSQNPVFSNSLYIDADCRTQPMSSPWEWC